MNARTIGINLASGGAWIFALCCCAILLAGFGGCASDPAWLTFKSEADQQVAHRFNSAKYSAGAEGKYDIVLTEQAGLLPQLDASSLPPGQTLHIRVIARPTATTREAMATTNSSLDLFITPAGADGQRLHYHGSGFVSVDASRNSSKIVIHHAKLELADGVAKASDVPAESSLSGSFKAIRDDAGISSTLAAIKSEMMRAQPTEASAHEGPPPRTPMGP